MTGTRWPLYPPKGIPFYLLDMPKQFLERLPQPEAPEDAVRSLRQNFAAGSDITKLFVATPQANRQIARMPVAIARAAAAETHGRGKLLLAHPTDIEGIRLALTAKVDVIVHTTLGERTPWPGELVKQMIEANMAVDTVASHSISIRGDSAVPCITWVPSPPSHATA